MDKGTIFLFVLLLFVGGGLGWYLKPNEVIDRTNYQQEKLDSLTSVIRNRTATAQSLKDSLAQTSQAFQDYINEHQGEIASLTTIRGQLNLKLDSLQRVNQTLSALTLLNPDSSNQVFKDTTITTIETFGDSLLAAQSDVIFQSDSLENKLRISQLRPVRVDVAILVSDDKRTIESIATSPDFDSLRVSAQTTIEPPKEKIHWTVKAGAVLVIRELIRLFN